jgi:hypothetical protein
MSLIMAYVTWSVFLIALAFFGWAAVFRPDFRKDVFGGRQGEAKVLGLVTVKGAAIIIIFALLFGGIFQVASTVNNAELADLRSQLTSNSAALDSLKADVRHLIFRPVDETDIPYCDSAGSPEPKAVPFMDAGGRPNLALLAKARATASSVIPVLPPGEQDRPIGSRHRVSYINDGWYNNCRSWIAAKNPAWLAIDLGDLYQIAGIAFGSEYEAYYKDRAATHFKVELSLNNIDWNIAYERKTGVPIAQRTVFDFAKPMNGRFVRLTIQESTPPNYPTSPGSVRVDELEIFGLASK